MSVELHTDRAVLAGSEPINSAHGGESDAEAPLNDPGAPNGQDSTPKRRGRGPAKPKLGVLVLTCERCSHPIAGSGAGFAYVDLRETHKAAERTAAGYIDPAKARWTLAHRTCAPEALAPMSGHHVVWVDRIGTTDDLLDAMARLSRSPWFAWSDWGSLVRGILADTETATVVARSHGAREAKRRAALVASGLDPDDSRHGTSTAYINYGCRCDRCKAGNTQRGREARANRTPQVQ